MRCIASAGFPNPSPIQSQCWPLALMGVDLIAVAKTGSGKTVGFLLPLFKHIVDTVRSCSS
jgi:superfamily II DNA/RNA helicase